MTTTIRNVRLAVWTASFIPYDFRKISSNVTSFALQLALLAVSMFLQGTSLRAQDSNLTQFRLDTNNWGGLVSSVAVHPRDANTIFIGTGRGGVYKSFDGGRHWDYLETFPSLKVNMISFSPSNPNHLVATSDYDTKTNRNGGIWLSTDQGEHWTAPMSSIPPITTRCPERVNASGISWVPESDTVWVASDCGLMRSDDSGEHWTGPILVDPSSSGGDDWRNVRITPDRMFSVLAIDGAHVIAGGESGYYYMHDGSSWHRSAGAQPNFYCPKGLAVAPGNPRLLFRADYNSHYLQYSDNQGVTWQDFPSPDLGAGNAGPFVRTTRSPLGPNYFEVYFGDGTNLKRATLRADAKTWSGTTWRTSTLDHLDPQDVGFDPQTGRPILLAADSGVMKTLDDGATWTSLGAGRAGLNALEIRGIGVQDFPRLPSRPDLSFITWHNNAWNSRDGGVTWTMRGIWEGKDIFTSGPALSDEADAFVSLRPFGGSSVLFGRGMVHLPSFDRPRSNDCQQYLTFYKNPIGGRPYMLNSSYSCEGANVIYDHRDVRGSTWQEIARNNVGAMLAIPQIAVTGRRASLYQPYLQPGSGNRLLSKVSNINREGGAGPVSSTPAMRGFGTLSVTLYDQTPVFAVKPDDDQVLIASDRTFSEMKMSRNGGEDWTRMDLLTRLVTDNDRLKFETVAYGGMSQATVIAFDPHNPQRVMVGTMESGVLVSWDGGNSWSRLRESEQIPHILTIAYSKTGAVYIGSTGRGLWKWEQHSIFNRPELVERWLCQGDCLGDVMSVRDPITGASVPIDLVHNPEIFRIIARKGYITNFSFDQKSRQFTLFATNPDSIIIYNSRQSNLPLQVLASAESDKHLNCPACNQDVEKGLRVKVLILKPGTVLGYVAAGKDKSEIPDQIMFGNEVLPDYKPTLLLEGVSRGLGYDLAFQGATLTIKGSGFAPTVGDKQTPRYVTIYLNGQRTHERVETDGKGAFGLKIELNTIPGGGMIEGVQQTSSGRISAEQRIMILNHDGRREPK